MLMYIFLFRPLFLEFAEKVFQVNGRHVRDTPAYQQHHALPQQEADDLLLAKVLSYAPSTWFSNTNPFKEYVKFCAIRGIDPLNSEPQTFNLFLLQLAHAGRTCAAIDKVCASVSFTCRFFCVPNVVTDPATEPILKFVGKVCPNRTNLKEPFSSNEVRVLWDAIENKYPGLSGIPLVELRTFVLAVTQYA
jgi:hypothetical protein